MSERRYRPVEALSEEEALQMLRSGDSKGAFAYFYRVHADTIRRYLFYRCGDGLLAEDLMNETFEKAIRHIDTYHDEGGLFKAWLYRIAGNALKDHARKKKNKPADRDLFGPSGDALLPYGERMEEEGIFDSSLIGNAMSSLTSLQRDAIEARFFNELSLSEAASEQGVSDNALKVRVVRGIDNLRRAFGVDTLTVKPRTGRTTKTKVE